MTGFCLILISSHRACCKEHRRLIIAIITLIPIAGHYDRDASRGGGGDVSVYRWCLTSIGISMLKIRWDHLIVNIVIPIHGKDGLCIETGPSGVGTWYVPFVASWPGLVLLCSLHWHQYFHMFQDCFTGTWQSYNCLTATDTTLKNMDKSTDICPQQNTKRRETCAWYFRYTVRISVVTRASKYSWAIGSLGCLGRH